MLVALVDQLTQSGSGGIAVAWLERPYGTLAKWPAVEHLPYPGSTVVDESMRTAADLIASAEPHHRFYLFGADVLDGSYSRNASLLRINLAHALSLSGAAVTIVGFSLNTNIDPTCMKALRRLPDSVKLCMRDPISYQRAEELGLNGIQQTADAAFLLEARRTPEIRSAEVWSREQRVLSRRVVGLNVSREVGELVAEKECSDPISDGIQFLCDKNVSFLLISHDIRAGQEDERWLNLVVERLDPRYREFTYLLSSDCSSSEIKAVCQELDLVLTCRMHLAIAALGMCVPAAAFDYHGKVEGLYKLFSWPEGLLSREHWKSANLFQIKVQDLLAGIENSRALIQRQLPKVRALAMQNL